ncbi:MAG TPA: Uma2 family endonuclease [Rhizomicrobium sp.]|jgi:Uma2 family endonuclease|nr:Uma2 family endonuclease [Rhizomicrobium sp.]
MTIAQRATMSLGQFLAWEERQDGRYEFDGIQPQAMTGGTIAHDQITFNVRKALDERLSGKPCRPFGPNVKIIAAAKVRYPDGIVTCSPTKPEATAIDDPVIVFEVVSEDSARTDRIEKLREYQATPAIQCYVILEQKSVGATVFSRRGDIWTAAALTEGDLLRMPEIGVEIPIIEFYAGLEFPALSDNPSQP